MNTMRIAVSDLEAGTRLDKLVAQEVPGIGRAGAKRLFAEGHVRVHDPDGTGRGRRASKGDVAVAGEVIEVEVGGIGPKGDALPEPGSALVVVLERDDLVIVDKPAGQATAPIERDEHGTLANALVGRYPEMAHVGFTPLEPGLCHRLDTDTSGLVLAARKSAVFATLVAALKQARLDKRYLLVCESADLPELGSIEVPLAPHPKDRRRVYPCIHPRDVARYAPRPAATSYKKIGEFGRFALVEARAPKALRHQIRAHFAALGHPLAGDELYGGPPVPGLTRHALHASYIGFAGAEGVARFAVSSPLPADMAALVGEDERGESAPP